MARHTCIQFRGAREKETKSQAAFKKRIAENTAKIEGEGEGSRGEGGCCRLARSGPALAKLAFFELIVKESDMHGGGGVQD